MKKNLIERTSAFFKSLYIKIFKINDSPQRIALGLGIGAFSGIMPGTGPLAALFLAFLLRANKASALIAALLTNTWLSVLAFALSVKAGAFIFGIKWLDLVHDWNGLVRNFNWSKLFQLSILRIALPVITGYIFIGLCAGLISYLAALIIITLSRRKRDGRI